jgi:hypothetical protein
MNGNYDHELIMTQNEYERTGKQIRIPEDELISVVLERIDHYLTLHPRERRNYPDPRKDPVVTRIASGKTIEVPSQIVDKAMEIHQACGRVGTVERMESVGKNGNSKHSVGEHNNLASAHTRLAKRERYAKSDPFVMNQDLRGLDLVGRDGQVAGDSTFGDFPQRYNDFNRSMSKYVSRDGMASDLDDRADPYNSNLHSRSAASKANSRANVGSFKFGQKTMQHTGGPNSRDNGDYMDEVSGVESDISPDGDSASVYAPLDEADDQRSNGQQHESVMRPDIVDHQDYSDEPDYNCSSCGHNDGYRSNYPYHPGMHPAERDNGHFDHRNFSDEYPSADGDYVPEPGYAPVDEDGFDVDEDGYYNGDENDSDKKVVENYANSSNSSYNYVLWLLLIVLVAVLGMNYYQKRNEVAAPAAPAAF